MLWCGLQANTFPQCPQVRFSCGRFALASSAQRLVQYFCPELGMARNELPHWRQTVIYPVSRDGFSALPPLELAQAGHNKGLVSALTILTFPHSTQVTALRLTFRGSPLRESIGTARDSRAGAMLFTFSRPGPLIGGHCMLSLSRRHARTGPAVAGRQANNQQNYYPSHANIARLYPPRCPPADPTASSQARCCSRPLPLGNPGRQVLGLG